MNRLLLCMTTLLALGGGTAFAQAKGQGALQNPEAFFDGRTSHNPAMEADASSMGAVPAPASPNAASPVLTRSQHSSQVMGWSIGIGAGAGAIAGGAIGAAVAGAGVSTAGMIGAVAGGAALGALAGLALGFLIGIAIAAMSGDIG